MPEVCAIIGAGTGISAGVARRFAREGYDIALVARSDSLLPSYVEDVESVGGVATGFSADAADVASLTSVFEKIENEMGAPDVLIYNAAYGGPGAPSSIAPEDLMSDFRVNVMGALVAAQNVIPVMRSRSRGTILLTGGGLALDPRPDYASLAIGKAGLRNLALSLFKELKPDHIHAATVTVDGFVQKGTFFDPDNIATAYWELHTQPEDEWSPEIVYSHTAAP